MEEMRVNITKLEQQMATEKQAHRDDKEQLQAQLVEETELR